MKFAIFLALTLLIDSFSFKNLKIQTSKAKQQKNKLEIRNLGQQNNCKNLKGFLKETRNLKNRPNRKLPDRTENSLGSPKSPSAAKPPGGKNNKISITPPPVPQQILPPKPIIVAPLIVRQRRKANKVMIIRKGNMFGNSMSPAPYTPGFQFANMAAPNRRRLSRSLIPPSSPNWSPYQMPNPMSFGPSFPSYNFANEIPQNRNRELYGGQQLSFNNISEDVPALTQSFKVSSKDNNIIVSTEKKKEFVEFLNTERGREFQDSQKKLDDIKVLLETIDGSFGSLKENLEKGDIELGVKLTNIVTLDNQERADGLAIG